ncbi:hypothetical protein FRZ67_01715 [Panacibacter ginsenosidivorans]|uniref:Uncharacterized protein n=1 Tax=Panacibacter ginsenosidivorans TaxID=1813871 RepID=A0A5B8V4E4_9BACT|nr:hypothetical protein [Panacibacter ginsenosidivorans]QEC66082.1 hypothetical protein FRZ67_01715 [Panacibacter ginsenosidivorans]
MYNQSSTDSIIINKIEDLLFIEVKDNSGKEAEYSIQSENERIIRKGRFKGHLIQLCLSHLASGYYKLFLVRDDNDIITYPFEKQSGQLLSLGR